MNASASTTDQTYRSAATPASDSLSQGQIAIVVAWGLVFWLVAALFIRYAPPAVFDGGASTALLFAASVPIAWPSVWITRRLAALKPRQVVPGAALASSAAMLCDGIGLTWSSLYAPVGAAPLAAAAWLLWGVGLILLAAFVTARRQGA